MRPLPPTLRLHRLAMVAVFVVEDVTQEVEADPWPGQARRDLDAAGTAPVAAETQMA